MRSFIAVDVPQQVKNHIRLLQDDLQGKGIKAKWINPENCHFTLLFLGDQPESALEKIKPILKDEYSKTDAVKLEYSQVNTFKKSPRVLFAEYESLTVPTFGDLVQSTINASEKADIELPDGAIKKEAIPHLTIARFKKKQNAKSLCNLGDWDDGKWHWQHEMPSPPENAEQIAVREVTLFQSILRNNGAEYIPLESFSLKLTKTKGLNNYG